MARLGIGVLGATVLAASAAAQLSATPVPLSPPQPTTAATAPSIAAADILALSAEFKARLDQEIRPIRNPVTRTLALHALLFEPTGYDVQYHDSYTLTAMQTLQQGRGNCVSLANLFVAAARHVGLNARFQESKGVEWGDVAGDDGYDVRSGHVNVLVLAGPKRMTVEFLAAYVGRESKTRKMPDAEAAGHFYNNLGMDFLHQRDLLSARLHVQKALEIYPRNALFWSNLGVLEKRLNNLAAAEKAYLTALSHDKKNPSASKNLYVLYLKMGEVEKAKRYAAIIEKHNLKNPYYLDRQANKALVRADFDEAIRLAERAIRIKKSEDRFYLSLAKAHYLAGDTKRAADAMRKALELTVDPEDRERYRRKLGSLAGI